MDNLIFDMGTNYEQFMQPLSEFKKRIAYINAFHTDFQVPTTTAAFLSEDSTYPHTILSHHSDETRCDPSFIVASIKSEKNDFILKAQVDKSPNEKKRVQDLIMSNKLDALGWQKIFIDSRDMNPIPTIPKGLYRPNKNKNNSDHTLGLNSCGHVLEIKDHYAGQLSTRNDTSISDDSQQSSVRELSTKDCSIDSNTVLESKEVKLYMTTRNPKLHIPVGHSMLIANSKSKGAEKFYARGRPIVDELAKNLVNELLQWKD